MRLLFLSLLLMLARPASAATVTNTGYDIRSGFVSGWGNWFNSYDGSVTQSAQTTDSAFRDFTGGSGTLSNGTTDSTAADAHWLSHDAGPGVEVEITLYLDDACYLTGIDLYGSHQAGNGLPGSVEGFTISGGGQTATIETVPFGFESVAGKPVDDHGDLQAAGFSDIAVNRVVLSGFYGPAGPGAGVSFTLSEIALEGSLSPVAFVPLPAGGPLLGGALMLLAARRRRR